MDLSGASPLPVLRPLDSEEAADDLSIVEESRSKKVIEGALKKFYEPMEVWYLRSSIDKVSSMIL